MKKGGQLYLLTRNSPNIFLCTFFTHPVDQHEQMETNRH